MRAAIILNKEACLERLTKYQEYLGIAEIAEVLGISKQVAVGWMKKDKLPPHHSKLAMGTIWHRDQVLDFLMQLPDTPSPIETETTDNGEETTTT